MTRTVGLSADSSVRGGRWHGASKEKAAAKALDAAKDAVAKAKRLAAKADKAARKKAAKVEAKLAKLVDDDRAAKKRAAKKKDAPSARTAGWKPAAKPRREDLGPGAARGAEAVGREGAEGSAVRRLPRRHPR